MLQKCTACTWHLVALRVTQQRQRRKTSAQGVSFMEMHSLQTLGFHGLVDITVTPTCKWEGSVNPWEPKGLWNNGLA